MIKVHSDQYDRYARIWVDDLGSVEAGALEQIHAMLRLPGLDGVSIMPDVHQGQGATIGAVVATTGHLVPNLVGVDIGCGVCAWCTGVPFDRERLGEGFWSDWRTGVQNRVPTGFNGHALGQTWDGFYTPLRAEALRDLVHDRGRKQLGTLGGGNHFCEAAFDETGRIWLLVHSGSRHIGLKIANHYNKLAEERCKRDGIAHPPGLPILCQDWEMHSHYYQDMQWATSYALENRYRMLEQMALAFLHAIKHFAPGYAERLWDMAIRGQAINIHHNFAQWEEHRGWKVMVHRKGATQARRSQLGIIPGSMGTATFIVEGLGNWRSYESCSHGAGRRMGRKAAKSALTVEQMAQELDGTFTTASPGLLDEAPGAYKDIDWVMAQQCDLVQVLHRLAPIMTIKGEGE